MRLLISLAALLTSASFATVPAAAVPAPADVDRAADTRIGAEVRLHSHDRYGARRGRTPRVYPRTRVVRDGLTLQVRPLDRRLRVARLAIKAPDGRVVLRRTSRDPGRRWSVRWTARQGGAPLPAGVYRAVVTGVDSRGSTVRSEPMRIRVSSRPLVWREKTLVVPASERRAHSCLFSTALSCGDSPPTGEMVPSERFPGGLTFRPLPGATLPSDGAPTAYQEYYLRLPETTGVRGVHRARVSFSGTPTGTGESDEGNLSLSTTRLAEPLVSSSSSATTPWTSHLFMGAADLYDLRLPRFDPGVVWSFYTRGDDSFDVDTFTVDVRYLAPATS